MKKLLKNKRGMAIESAILFMLIVFMFGFLLTGVAMVSHLRVKVNDTLLNREMEIEQIGEDFVRMNETDEKSFNEHIKANFSGNYTAAIATNDNKTLTLTRNDSVVLYIELDSEKNVKVWKYSDKGN